MLATARARGPRKQAQTARKLIEARTLVAIHQRHQSLGILTEFASLLTWDAGRRTGALTADRGCGLPRMALESSDSPYQTAIAPSSAICPGYGCNCHRTIFIDPDLHRYCQSGATMRKLRESSPALPHGWRRSWRLWSDLSSSSGICELRQN